ncbi:dihydroxy-acid dehydratase [Marivita sp. S2033]|uniref:dihydroxy-acid dehydratase n=1 Tax=Marivita sp. S2033 TaxID=3373187 RepID=UPI00398200BE
MTSIRTTLSAALMGATLVLAGCDPTAMPGSLSLLETGSQGAAAPLAAASLAGGAVVVSGPGGYCVDAKTLRNSDAGGFAAIASCSILSGGRDGPMVEPGLVTITVSRAPEDVPAPSDLAAALNTQLLQNRKFSAVDVGLMASGGESAFQGSDPRHWRGAFVLGEWMVGLALYAPKGSPLVGSQGAAFLNTVSSRIRASSPTPATSAELSQPSTGALAAQFDRLSEAGDLQ